MRTVFVHSSDDESMVARFRALSRLKPAFHNSICVTPDEAEKECLSTPADLIVAAMPIGPAERCLELVTRLRRLEPAHVLAVGPATDPKLILRVIQCGADLFLDQDDFESELDSALGRLRMIEDEPLKPARLWALLSASGGCGASTLAVNVAVLLAKQHGSCNLIDLNLGKGDLAPLLDLRPKYSLADLCRNESRLDRALYESLLARHSSGVSLLAAPKNYGDVRVMTPRAVAQTLSLACKMFPQIVVDLEDCFHDEQMHVLDQATDILLVCRMDFTSMRNLRRILDQLTSQRVPRSRIKLVVNQFGQPGELPVAEAQDAVGEKLTCFVPYEPKTVFFANNTGVPSAVQDPNAKVVQSVARLLAADTDAPPKSGSKSGLIPIVRSWFPVAQ